MMWLRKLMERISAARGIGPLRQLRYAALVIAVAGLGWSAFLLVDTQRREVAARGRAAGLRREVSDLRRQIDRQLAATSTAKERRRIRRTDSGGACCSRWRGGAPIRNATGAIASDYNARVRPASASRGARSTGRSAGGSASSRRYRGRRVSPDRLLWIASAHAEGACCGPVSISDRDARHRARQVDGEDRYRAGRYPPCLHALSAKPRSVRTDCRRILTR